MSRCLPPSVRASARRRRSFVGVSLLGLVVASGCSSDTASTDTPDAALDVAPEVGDTGSDAHDVTAPDADDSSHDATTDGSGGPDVDPPPPTNDLVGAGELVPLEALPGYRTQAPDVRVDRLCPVATANPDALEDPVNIDCLLEAGSFAPAITAPLPAQLTVLVWNVERGLQFDRILEAFSSGKLPDADVLLLSELDRGCSRTGYRDVTRELAQALGMHYVFATEFVELPRAGGAGGTIETACEHGNAILSRFPLANAQAAFHRQNHVWYLPPDRRDGGEPRLGGRVLLWADVVVGQQLLRAYSLHYESNPTHQAIQIDQAIETAEHPRDVPWQVVIGGDTNNVVYFLDLISGQPNDPTVGAFFDRGYLDAHAPLPQNQRGTRGGFVIDLLFGNADFFVDPGICVRADCAYSDHQPVWATVVLDGAP